MRAGRVTISINELKQRKDLSLCPLLRPYPTPLKSIGVMPLRHKLHNKACLMACVEKRDYNNPFLCMTFAHLSLKGAGLWKMQRMCPTKSLMQHNCTDSIAWGTSCPMEVGAWLIPVSRLGEFIHLYLGHYFQKNISQKVQQLLIWLQNGHHLWRWHYISTRHPVSGLRESVNFTCIIFPLMLLKDSVVDLKIEVLFFPWINYELAHRVSALCQ